MSSLVANKPKLIPSPEQEHIIQLAAEGRHSVMIDAGAGCAKSATLEMLGEVIKVPALNCAFNVRNVKEMEGRFPGNFTLKTMNSLGFAALARARPQNYQVDTNKLGKLVKQVVKDRKVDLDGNQFGALRQMVSKAQQVGLVPAGLPEGLVPDSLDSWQAIADDLGLDGDDFEYLWELAREILGLNVKLALTQGIISFDDQIYCSVLLGGRFIQYPVLFCDEYQDQNLLNILMIQKMVREDARVFATGDFRQGIYAFRGAAGDAGAEFQKLRGIKPWVHAPLMTTFRCPKSVVARQQDHAPGYIAAPANPEGEVILAKPGWDFEMLESLRSKLGANTIAVLCRNNGPLLGLGFKLIRRGIGINMLGRDIGKGLTAITKKIWKDSYGRDEMAQALADWGIQERSIAEANGKEHLIEGITDREECLKAVLDSAGASSPAQARNLLDMLFSSEGTKVTLSSGHRAKGAEWPLVVHLDPWRIPSQQAKKAAKAGDMGPLQQERNLKYVIETRTRHTLVLASLEDFDAPREE